MSDKKFKEFPISSWAIDNRITIFLLTLVIALIGATSFMTLPKENFPEIAWPVIYVSTPYPGTSAQDIENLVSRKIEKELNGVEGLKELNSTSIQDFSSVFVEFETDVNIEDAKREVQEAVDRAKSELPNDLPNDPLVVDINFSEIPIMYINLSGNYDNTTLKRYGEDMQDEIEKLKEIRRVDLVGAREREIQVNIDVQKLELHRMALDDVEQAIANENVIISGGELDLGGQKIAVRVNGEFQTVKEIEDIVVRSPKGDLAYIRDIAEVVDGYEDNDSYARLAGKPVLTLSVVKKAGENLVDASDKIKVIIDDMKAKKLPDALDVTLSIDQSVMTRNMLGELNNTIILGFILVTLVLMFFMGVRDAIFVGLAVPLSSLIAFATLPALGYTMNLVVLFSFILAMGIVVDNAIVVIENTYRIFNEQGLPIIQAAKKAAGEVIGPVFAGTLTTICPFLPLLFWPGPVGEFMGFLPVVMIITLFASLFVAYVINPVFAATFMTRDDGNSQTNIRRVLLYTGIAVGLAILLHLTGSKALGNLMIIMAFFVPFNAFVLKNVIAWFQGNAIPSIKNVYRNLLSWSLRGWNGLIVLASVIILMLVSVMIFGSRVQNGDIRIVQFPDPAPNFIYVYNEMPNGTDIEITDSITRILEDRVNQILGENNPVVKSVITNVAKAAGDPNSFDQNTSQAHKSKVTVEFVMVKERGGVDTYTYLEKIRENVKDISGTRITVEKDSNGPPGAAPVELLLTSEDFDALMETSTDLLQYLDSLNIDGVEKLKWDVDEKRPEILVNINRAKALELGISSGQIGMALRTAIFGKEAAKFRTQEDEYPIQIRLMKKYRQDISSLLNMRLTYLDMGTGELKSVPISAVADFSINSEYGGINRTDQKKSVTISSNILSDADANQVNATIKYWLDGFLSQGRKNQEVDIEVGGIIVEQAEEGAFLGMSFLYAILLIFMILVTQFNSFLNVVIILFQVVLSLVGVFLGYAVLAMDFSVVLTGVGIVVLAGIVVNNGIILLDFFRILEKEGLDLKESVIEGGATRLTPVLLTATSTVLGLVPLAISLNLNFGTLLSDWDPQIFFGGDSSAFWEPLSWSIIFGLSFATIVTLVLVPIIYYYLQSWTRSIGAKLNLVPQSSAYYHENGHQEAYDTMLEDMGNTPNESQDDSRLN